MKYQQLVVNGCSYMEAYARGQGHQHLAESLDIPLATSLAIAGSANNRILRTTLKHSYFTTVPTFYVLGMTFLSRDELPILKPTNSFEGKWTNPQNQDFEAHWEPPWCRADTDVYIELKLKWEHFSVLDRLEDLQYRMLATVNDLSSRGHAVLIYNQADSFGSHIVKNVKCKWLSACANIVDGFAWSAIPWQHSQNVPLTKYASHNNHTVPPEMAHREIGFHQALNSFLTKYIEQHKILQ